MICGGYFRLSISSHDSYTIEFYITPIARFPCTEFEYECSLPETFDWILSKSVVEN